MKLSRNTGPAGRGGFTLVELLVVISIISILVALTAAAVMRAFRVGPRVTTKTEVGQLDGAVVAAQGTGGYDTGYFPSRLILRKYYGDYFTATGAYKSDLDQDSVNFLMTMFKSGSKFKNNWTNNGINWQTGWAAYKPGGPGSELLEGDQCLVFFLGGIQTTDASGTNSCLGFSTNNAQPDQLGGDRKSFYEFKSARLIQRSGKTFFSYADAYGLKVPYAYFSSYGKTNGYNRYGYDNNYYNPASKVALTSDCSSLGLWPYAQSGQPTWTYLKPNTFQILSAGQDGQFGPGSNPTSPTPYFWSTATAGNIPKAGDDDQANFAPNTLGAGQ